MMRRKWVWSFVCIAAATVFVSAGAGICRAVELSADMVTKSAHGTITGKVYFKGDNYRQETNMQGRNQVIIHRKDTGLVWVLMPAQKMYMEMSADQQAGNVPITGEERLEEMAEKESLGQEVVNGYQCDKYRFIFHDSSMGTMTQWISQQYEFPVKIISDGPHGHSVTEYTNIKGGPISDTLFKIPAGYNKMQMPGGMPHGGR